ncbi:hypothetical protein GIB67_005535 [Kingdonia uniflora]|uniref:BHLH domain-containing protein n=1 Tax=Kingdonia uniflora TaxID=39325 RepID=A0A7J7NHX0_9MAGN|nr:hypothetical protein GIB67_005535 [Kingdonia uniflora]
MLHITGNCTDMTILERQQQQQPHFNWQPLLQQQQETYFGGGGDSHFDFLSNTQQLGVGVGVGLGLGGGYLNNEAEVMVADLANRPMKYDPGFENNECWPGFVQRTVSCPPLKFEEKNFKKRKAVADKSQNSKIVGAEETREKRIRVDAKDESKHTEQKSNERETSGDTSKENSKVTEVPKTDYIHVRARRGQATDSHSLAERVRREKISERMKYLQDLVPGCNKITGKAGMLDEIINYVQALQGQVEFLSMRLATINPGLDINVDNFFAKETFPTCSSSFPAVGVSSEIANCPAPYLQFNPAQQISICSGMDMVINPTDMALRRTTSTPVNMPEVLLDTSCFTQAQSSITTWETDLQNLYNVEYLQGRSNVFPPQSFTDILESNNLKMEL